MQEIKNGAIFIADSHYPHHGDEFMDILQKIDIGELQPTQLFLMGDVFDLLFGYNSYITTFVDNVIELLNKLSLTVEIYYFEGNHDFCLKDIFPHIKVFSREQQPVYMNMDDKKVGLSHGDRFDSGFLYDLYCKVLRNKFTLNILKPFQKQIIDYRMKKLARKNICHEFIDFKEKAEKITSCYKDIDLIIEGHFHQAKQFDRYASLPSLACQKKIAIIEDNAINYISVYNSQNKKGIKMDIQKLEQICRPGRIALGLILLGLGFYTGNDWFLLGLIPLVIGIFNIKPFCFFTGKCNAK